MNDQGSDKGFQGGFLQYVWQHKMWWLMSLMVLIVLLGILYALTHLSSTDSEMYPTTTHTLVARARTC
jgi:uncharacterized membrane protein